MTEWKPAQSASEIGILLAYYLGFLEHIAVAASEMVAAQFFWQYEL
jgi:hypothetical protein